MTDESTTSTETLYPAEGSTSVYSFETDSLAFRGNKDYQRLLGTIVTLESQRVQALRDIDTLMTCQRAALADPIQFVHRLQQGTDLDLPPRQKVAELPPIAWENYTSSLETMSWARRHATRHKNKTDLNSRALFDDCHKDVMFRLSVIYHCLFTYKLYFSCFVCLFILEILCNLHISNFYYLTYLEKKTLVFIIYHCITSG